MITPPPVYFVFVDFENVPDVDPGVVKGLPVQLTLLIGRNQKSFRLEMVRAAQVLGDRLELVEVGSSGRNALDLTLAWYLGRAVERNPRGSYFVVSKDKDFEPMIGHLQGKGVTVSRHDSLSSLPFLARVAKAAAHKPPAPLPKAQSKATVPAKPKLGADKLEKFIVHLRNSPPANRTKLEHLITAFFKPTLPAGGMKGVIAQLVERRIVAFDDANKVSYPGA